MLPNARCAWWTSPLVMSAVLFGLLAGASVATAQKDDAPASKKSPTAKKDAQADENPYAVPKDATPQELLDHINTVVRRRPRTEDQQKQWLQAIVTAADGVLESKKADDKQQSVAMNWKFQALQAMVSLQFEGAEKQFDTFYAKLKDSKNPAAKKLVDQYELKRDVKELLQAEGDEQAKRLDAILARLKQGTFTAEQMQLGQELARQLEYGGHETLAVKVYETLATAARDSGNDRLEQAAAKLEGTVRRLRLPGNEIDIQGQTLQGKNFNIRQWRGKVVLVDFWATWCGPCVAELPNVKENYRKYHDKGFEVVGISLDNDVDRLEKFIEDREIPWTTLFDRKSEEQQGWNNPLAEKYGVNAIPTVILVNKEGKVVSLHARGEKLGTLLADLLGPTDDDAPAKPSSKEKE